MASVLALLAGVSLGAQAVDSGLVARLTSGDVGTRMQAVRELQGAVAENLYTLKQETLRDAVIKSLELENALVAADFRRVTQGQGGPQLQEAYSEHYAALLGIADQLQREAPPDNPLAAARLFRALVCGSYNPQSEFVSSLAMAGEPIVPHVLELANGPLAENAYALIAALLQSHDRGALRKPLSATSAPSVPAA